MNSFGRIFRVTIFGESHGECVGVTIDGCPPGVSLTIDDTTYLDDILNELKSFGTVEVDRDQTIICVVGDFSAEKQGYGSRVLETLKELPIRMISYGGSKHNLSVLVKSEDKVAALQSLHKGLF